MNRKLLTLTLILSLCKLSYAQDSIKTFSKEDLYWYLDNFHPIGKQASLLIKKGENEVRKTKCKLSLTEIKQIHSKDHY